MNSLARHLPLFTLWAAAAIGSAQTITTVAGGGPADGTLAVSVALGPVASGNSVAVDSAGNLYVAAGALNRVFKVTPAGALSTVAGNGAAAYSGDGASATSAELNSPQGVAVDSAGNLFIADNGNRRIRKVSGGIITTVAGNGITAYLGDGGQATSASLFSPSALALDKSGNLFLIDDNVVREVAGGIITTVVGNGSYGYSGDNVPAATASLAGPTGLAVDSAGNIYIADRYNNRIRKVAGGVIASVAGNGTPAYAGDGMAATAASLYFPAGVAVGADGSLYIADSGDQRVRKVAGGVINTFAGNGTPGSTGDGAQATAATLAVPFGVALDTAGNAYIATLGDSRVRKVAGGIIGTVAGNGNIAYSGDGGLATSAQLYTPSGVAFDRAGNLYIADALGARVYRVSGGAITSIAGNGTPGYSGDGKAATSAQLDNPMGIAFDGAGNLYIADSGNNCIRQVSAGIITTVAGTGVAGHIGDGAQAVNAQLWFPTGVAVDPAGNLLIADTGSHRIRKVTAGVINNFAGNGNYGYGGDGAQAVNAELASPHGVAVDAAGNVYVADTSNDRVRVIANGVITTLAGNGTPGSTGDGGPAMQASIYEPATVAVDASGNVYFDSGFGRVRRVAGGVITTLAGVDTFTFGFSGDGGPAPRALLNYPSGVVADAAGDVWIADMMNGRVRQVAAPTTVTADLVTPSAGSGSQTITFRFSDPKGWQDLDVVNVLINNFLDGRQSCYLAYSRTQNVLYLVNDAGTGLLPGLTLGGTGNVSNGQCAVGAAGSSATGLGNTLTLTLNMVFSAGFAGNKIVYLASRDLGTGNSGWQALGTWTVPGAATGTVSVGTVSPAHGAGTGQTLTFTFTDTKGFQNLGVMDILINNFLDGRQACYLAYSQPLAVLYLVNDTGSGLLPGLTLGGAGSVSNSQCTVSGATSSAAGSANTLTLTLSVSFSPAFAGNRVIYMAALDAAGGNNTGWQAMGSWTVQ
ncbi:MAG TPA: hypothetical protein VE959_35805 [Bryobacteraceae bacterium]|nr:hypothetical protein [Bryobacteraceae bacterium]